MARFLGKHVRVTTAFERPPSRSFDLHESGNPLTLSPMPGDLHTPVELKVSEIFRSIQGEGASAGRPCAFLRLAGCNLRCTWCDTPYTWDWQNYDHDSEVERVQVEQVRQRLLALGESRLVITGGEPLLQQAALTELLGRLDSTWVVEVETNGTVLPNDALCARVNQWNVSPKLGHAGDSRERRLRPEALLALKETRRAWLKLVIQSDTDLVEVEDLLQATAWPRDRVLLMPEARTREALEQRSRQVAELALDRGLAFSPRLHLELWGGRRGV